MSLTVMETVLTKGITEVPVLSDEDIAHLQERHSKMLGVESAARDALGTRIEKLKATRQFAGMPTIDERVFTWRWPKRARDYSSTPGLRSCAVPRVGLLHTDSPVVRLHHPGGSSTMRVESGDGKRFPDTWRKCLQDISKDLRSIAGKYGDSYLRFRWDGVIPNAARGLITQAQTQFGADNVFLLVETPAKSWKLDAPSIAERVDPLIVGYSGDMFFYVGQFDPTDLESYIADEFTS